jgi:hypothetical protein
VTGKLHGGDHSEIRAGEGDKIVLAAADSQGGPAEVA